MTTPVVAIRRQVPTALAHAQVGPDTEGRQP
jgi:hypothetical protein